MDAINPIINGTATLPNVVITTALVLFLIKLVSNSIQMININKIKPIWLKKCKFSKEFMGNRKLDI